MDLGMDQADASSAPPPPPEQTKRKATESTSKYWVHFDKIVDNDGRVRKAKCKYCKELMPPIRKNMARQR